MEKKKKKGTEQRWLFSEIFCRPCLSLNKVGWLVPADVGGGSGLGQNRKDLEDSGVGNGEENCDNLQLHKEEKRNFSSHIFSSS